MPYDDAECMKSDENLEEEKIRKINFLKNEIAKI